MNDRFRERAYAWLQSAASSAMPAAMKSSEAASRIAAIVLRHAPEQSDPARLEERIGIDVRDEFSVFTDAALVTRDELDALTKAIVEAWRELVKPAWVCRTCEQSVHICDCGLKGEEPKAVDSAVIADETATVDRAKSGSPLTGEEDEIPW